MVWRAFWPRRFSTWIILYYIQYFSFDISLLLPPLPHQMPPPRDRSSWTSTSLWKKWLFLHVGAAVSDPSVNKNAQKFKNLQTWSSCAETLRTATRYLLPFLNYITKVAAGWNRRAGGGEATSPPEEEVEGTNQMAERGRSISSVFSIKFQAQHDEAPAIPEDQEQKFPVCLFLRQQPDLISSNLI